ncbi:MAG: hypothetical protein DRN55_05790 [Thermoplasmata archaeon]|nr:MAG: hypothetical protein DRN55_05790 [Thermoplasmata archaeon]
MTGREVPYPPAFIERYSELLGDELEDFLEALKRPLRRSLRLNTLRGELEELKERLSYLGLEPVPSFKYAFYTSHPAPGSTLEHYLGLYYIQEVSAMLAVPAMDPKPGERILDIAAAPGGKSTQICQHMENRGVLVANEPNPARRVILTGNLERMGCAMATVTGMDGRYLRPPPLYDRVLVDPPCSSEGTIRKNWSALVDWSEGLHRRFVHIQRGLVKAAANLLKPGGVLLYSTCTFAPEENEGVVSWALERLPLTVERVSIEGFEVREGVAEFRGERYSEEVKHCVRIYPHLTNTGGFFIARMRRLEE